MPDNCSHSVLKLQSSRHATIAGYYQPDAPKLVAATTPSGRVNKSASSAPDPSVFPAPLVLPDDDLANDPKQTGQSLRGWVQLKDRNEVTDQRKTIYVSGPARSDELPLRSRLERWALPRLTGEKDTKLKDKIFKPSTDEVVGYLEAFYHGMKVRRVDDLLKFTSWDDKETLSPSSPDPTLIGLVVKTEMVGIRTRSCPDQMFDRQLNLSDLLDGCISALPTDAYALVMMTDQDLYEDDEDDFCCGRAYGGSRVAVVSSARYHPLLDDLQSVEREHAWPASHCENYVEYCCSEYRSKNAKKKKPIVIDDDHGELALLSPMRAALSAYASAPSSIGSNSPELLAGLWLGRVCRTISHELGHCFGIDHCVYYACAMQSTASISEDVRQPPYLCPVDLAKVLRATKADEAKRCRAMVAFCTKHKDVQLFQALKAWSEAVLDAKLTL